MSDIVNNEAEPVITVQAPELVREQIINAPKYQGKRMRFALVHAKGSMEKPPCGGVAFFYATMPKAGKTLDPTKARGRHGETYANGTPIRCSTCGHEIGLPQLNLYVQSKKHGR